MQVFQIKVLIFNVIFFDGFIAMLQIYKFLVKFV